MKTTTLSLIAALSVALLSTPAFAANQIERDSDGVRMQNPTLINTEGSGAFANSVTRIRTSDENYGIAPTWDNREAAIRGDRLQNPSLIDTEGSGVFTRNQGSEEHYGLAPSWENRKGNAAEMRMVSPSLHGVFDNVGS